MDLPFFDAKLQANGSLFFEGRMCVVKKRENG